MPQGHTQFFYLQKSANLSCLRKIAAISLWGILLFNWVGYRLLNSIMEEHASRLLETRLDQQQYDDRQLISIKVPVTHLSYYNSSFTFERTSGQIEINGVPYRYVKRRICNDSLEMLCIPNHSALKIRNLANDFYRQVNDIGYPQGSKSNSHPLRSFQTDPFICIHLIHLDAPSYTVISRGYYFFAQLPSTSIAEDERPPAHTAA